jgi:diadenosine tetraphosphate (Ap4A) HIT family hydrolase
MMRCTFCNLIANTNDPTRIVDMEHTVAFVNLEQTYRGRSILVLKQHYDDLLSIPKELFDQVNTEMLKLASAIDKILSPDRLNFAILGNEVSHVHWHIIPRYKTDPNWGRPPWPIDTRVSLPDEEYRRLADLLRSILLNNSSL